MGRNSPVFLKKFDMVLERGTHSLLWVVFRVASIYLCSKETYAVLLFSGKMKYLRAMFLKIKNNLMCSPDPTKTRQAKCLTTKIDLYQAQNDIYILCNQKQQMTHLHGRSRFFFANNINHGSVLFAWKENIDAPANWLN